MLDRLRLFARVAELKSFTRAADALGLAQPSVSRLIGQLERDWNGALFTRTGRGVSLTDFGAEALARTTSLLRELDGMNDDLRSIAQEPAGHVTLAMVPSIIAPLLPDIFNRLALENPRITLRVREGFGEQVKGWLADGSADIGIFSHYHVEGHDPAPIGREALVLAEERIVVTGGATEPPAEQLPFAGLAGLPLVLPAAGSGLRSLIETVARDLSVDLRVRIEADSALAQRVLAQAGECFMLHGARSPGLQLDAAGLSSRIITDPGLSRRTTLQLTPRKHISRAVRRVHAVIAALRASPIGRDDGRVPAMR